jgi:carbonic anhydrase
MTGESQASTAQSTARRRFIKGIITACCCGEATFGQRTLEEKARSSLSKGQQDQLTPDKVIESLKRGNERFRGGQMISRDLAAQKRSAAQGQFPAAVILGCIDSRAPAEIIMDTGIGDTFNARIAGNVVNDDILGSMEFACSLAGAKVVLVLGHSACGAIKGAIDDVVMGNLTGLLARIKPAIAATHFAGDRSSKNPEYVDAVAKTNVTNTMKEIRRRSKILSSMEEKKSIKIIGAMYDLNNGMIDFLS